MDRKFLDSVLFIVDNYGSLRKSRSHFQRKSAKAPVQ